MLVLIKEDHPVALPRNNQGRGARMATVCLVSMLIEEAILITEDMGVSLICNHPQSQGASTQTNASESRVTSDDSPSSGLLERRLETMTQKTIPLMPRSSSLGWV